MGRPNKWVGEKLNDLLLLNIDELCIKYPNEDRNKLRALKSYHIRKMEKMERETGQDNNFGDILKLHNMTPELAKEFQEQGFHVGFIKNAEGEIEYTVPLPNAKKKNGLDPELFVPATPAKITPSRRKFPERDHKLLFLFSDTQIDFRRVIDGRTGEQELIPIHDEAAIRAAQLVAADLQPDFIINCGDTVDYNNISRWPANSDHFFKTMGLSHQAAHDMYAQFRADNPNARIIEVDSNHNERLKKFVLKNFPQAYDLYRPGDDSEYPVLTYPYLANLGALGVEYFSGGQEAEFLYGEDYTEVIGGRTYNKPPFRFAHGTETGQQGQAVQKIAKNHPETHNAQGHAHTDQYMVRVNRLGQRLINMAIPTLAKTTGEVDSYHSQVDDRNRVTGVQEVWPQGVKLIRDYDGEYVVEDVPIRDGVAIARNREYDGRA